MQALARDTGELVLINKGHGSHISGERQAAVFIICKRSDVIHCLRIQQYERQTHIFFAVSSLGWP